MSYDKQFLIVDMKLESGAFKPTYATDGASGLTQRGAGGFGSTGK